MSLKVQEDSHRKRAKYFALLGFEPMNKLLRATRFSSSLLQRHRLATRQFAIKDCVNALPVPSWTLVK